MKDLSNKSDRFFASLPIPNNPTAATLLILAARAFEVFECSSKFTRTAGLQQWTESAETQEECNLRNGWLAHCLARHFAGDWGDVCEEDWEANQAALQDGSRLFSVYVSDKVNARIYIITEADRSLTTLLFPDEY